MLRFIFSMLFYGAFLGILAIVCMWFFLGMTVQQSIDWLIDKVSQTSDVVSDGVKDVGNNLRNAGAMVDRQLERINDAL